MFVHGGFEPKLEKKTKNDDYFMGKTATMAGEDRKKTNHLYREKKNSYIEAI